MGGTSGWIGGTREQIGDLPEAVWCHENSVVPVSSVVHSMDSLVPSMELTCTFHPWLALCEGVSVINATRSHCVNVETVKLPHLDDRTRLEDTGRPQGVASSPYYSLVVPDVVLGSSIRVDRSECHMCTRAETRKVLHTC